MNVAIITARGGSKRVPRKNIKDFCGSPIIMYSITAALESNLFQEVMVSTDDEEIADIARKAGANVPFMRSSAASNDYATTSDVLSEVLGKYHQRGIDYDYMACLYPTAPFITAEKLKAAMDLLLSTDSDSVIPVVQFSFPPQRCNIIRNGLLEMKWPENLLTRSQDLEPLYHDCGQFYVAKVASFWKYKQLLMPRTRPLIFSEEEVQDIDNESDWNLAEVKYRVMIQNKLECET